MWKLILILASILIHKGRVNHVGGAEKFCRRHRRVTAHTLLNQRQYQNFAQNRIRLRYIFSDTTIGIRKCARAVIYYCWVNGVEGRIMLGQVWQHSMSALGPSNLNPHTGIVCLTNSRNYHQLTFVLDRSLQSTASIEWQSPCLKWEWWGVEDFRLHVDPPAEAYKQVLRHS